ncbi:MAG TPA: lysylphosphatidylglycerol synthase transmembrane domain-containing protein [Planctomycetota bacterium]|jgi:uncharacterized protein (TIRG00374 family)
MKKWVPILWIIVLAVMFGGVVFAVIKFWPYFKQFPEMVEKVPATGWLLMGLATSLCYLMDYLRLYTLLRVLGHRLNLWAGLQAMAVSEFASIVTPTAELHIPATVYVLVKKHVPVAQATAATVSKTLYILMWVSLFGLVAVNFPGHAKLPHWFEHYTIYCSIPIGLIVAFFFCIVFFAVAINRAMRDRMEMPGIKPWKKRVFRWLQHSTANLAVIGTSTDLMHFLAHVSAIGYIFAYCVLGYVLSYYFDLHVTFVHALLVFTLSLVIIYIGIVPGSIGVAEIGTALMLDPNLFDKGVPHPALVVAILLRFFSRYLMLFPGGGIFLHIVYTEGFKYFERRASQRMAAK